MKLTSLAILALGLPFSALAASPAAEKCVQDIRMDDSIRNADVIPPPNPFGSPEISAAAGQIGVIKDQLLNDSKRYEQAVRKYCELKFPQ